MKILLAVHHFPPHYTGGAELRAFRTAVNLQQRGHTLRVVCVERVDAAAADGPLACQVETYEGLEVHRLSFRLAAAPDPFVWAYDNPWVAEYLREQFSLWNPDIFHLISGYLISAASLREARLAGVRRVVTLTDYWWLCPRIQMLRSDGTISTLPIRSETCARCLGEEQRRYRVPGRLFPGWMNVYWRLRRGSVERAARRTQTLREELNQADRIICPSRFLMEIHQSEGIDPRKMIHSRQGRDFPDLAPEALAKTPADTLRLGYIGQIAEIKGVHLLFEAARQLPASRLRVRAYGDTAPFPQYTARLRNMAAADARLELCGAFQKHEVTAVMQTLDAIVVPSVWYENSPNVILEAFAHRTPVIASNLGGMAELIEHGKNGLLFTPNDPADLARQIERLNREPALLEQLRQGIEPIKAVSQEMDELEAVYACLTRLS